MNKKNLLQKMLCLTLIALLLVGCGVPGIDEPLTIEGIPFQITSVSRQDEYESSGQVFSPTSSEDEFLIVVGTAEGDVEWVVTLTDETGYEDSPVIASRMGGGQKTMFTWIFVVARSSESFTLNLPGENTIQLDSLLD